VNGSSCLILWRLKTAESDSRDTSYTMLNRGFESDNTSMAFVLDLGKRFLP
jgi:hypothetical protein